RGCDLGLEESRLQARRNASFHVGVERGVVGGDLLGLGDGAVAARQRLVGRFAGKRFSADANLRVFPLISFGLSPGSSRPSPVRTSGHAMMSFSIATIFAHRYRQHRWVPWVTYGLAGVVSFSRIATSAHFPSDVLFGAATGFAIARYSVLHGQ